MVAKINDEQLRNIPISFSKIKDYESEQTDCRFTEVLIKILHLGRNYNGSIFKQDVVEQAIPTLANTPILGFIEPNKEDEDDFSNHRMELVNDNGTLKMQYMGHAYGVISESQANEAYFEDQLCSDGITRTYLFVKGLLFNKFDYVIDMFKSHNGSYNQSMELSENYTGTFDKKEGGFVFDSFQFDGACIITCDPAMIDSKITTNFSKQNNKSIAEEIENKLNEFAKYFSKKEEEQENMAKKDTTKSVEEKEEFKKATQVESNDETKVENNSKPSKEEPKDKSEIKEFDANNQDDDSEVVKAIEDVADKLDDIEDAIDGGSDEDEEDFAKKSKADKKVDDTEDLKDGGVDEDKEKMSCEDEEDYDCGDGKKKYTLAFSLSYEDIRSQIYDKLYDMENIENTCYGIIETKDGYFIYADYCNGQFYKQSYIKTDDSIAFTGEREEIFNVFVDKETKDAIANVTYSKLKEELDNANKKIEDYSKANEELLKFQLDIKENERKAEIDEVISRFSTIDALDLEKCRQKAYNKELNAEQLEEKLYAIVGKMNFSKKVETEKLEGNEADSILPATNYSVSIKESTDKSKCPYEGCEGLFNINKLIK